MVALHLSNVCKYYADLAVLNNIELSIEQGCTTGLIGANGEGKTTLFKCLLDACHIDSGSIDIFSQAHTQVKARSYLAFLPEHFQAPFYLTGNEFLQLMLSLHQTDFHQEIAETMLAELLFDLPQLKKPARNYSKGMMQKLGLTACLCSNKPILILDEPMSGLDPTARYALRNLLIKQKKQGKTLIFSTHLLHDIESTCDRIAILAAGKIRFHGTVENALDTYQATSLEQAYLHCLASYR
ncbi:MAG: ABC transporter ATP-binding protein [Methylococcales bacterium]